MLEKVKDSRGLAELFGVAWSVLVPPVSEPGLDLSLGESALLPQAHHLTLSAHKHKYVLLLHYRPMQIMQAAYLACQNGGPL